MAARPLSATAQRRPTTAGSARGGGGTKAQVAVRIRPANATDPLGDRVVVTTDGPVVAVEAEPGRRPRDFTFDHVFTGGQAELFDRIGAPLLEEAWKGFNVTLFAYGQTGSGKTYSMQGRRAAAPTEDGDDTSTVAGGRAGSAGSSAAPGVDNADGLIPRLLQELFRGAQERVEEDAGLTVKITMSYLEVYMERVRDLLAPRRPGVEPEALEILEGPALASPGSPASPASPLTSAGSRRVEIKGLGVHPVLGADRVAQLLELGNTNRQTAETKMNEVSSRSHSIVQLTLSQLHESPDVRDLQCTLNLVDLAGSERQSKTESSGLAFEEAKKINLSLLTLGRALHSFSTSSGDVVSLRESKLTRLLADSFGGNSKLWMLATVAPTAYNVTESLATLEYATHAKRITNMAQVNRIARHMEAVELRKQVQQLEAALELERSRVASLEQDVLSLSEENATLAAALRDIHDSGLLISGVDAEGGNELDSLLQKEMATTEHLQHYLALLQDKAGPPDASAAVPAKAVPAEMFVGRANISLASVLDGRKHSAVLPLAVDGEHASAGTGGPQLVVQLAPMDVGHIPTAGGKLAWDVTVQSASGLPASASREVRVRMSFRFDADCVFESPPVGHSIAPVFDFHRRFVLHRASRSLLQYCREQPVMVFEVLGLGATSASERS